MDKWCTLDDMRKLQYINYLDLSSLEENSIVNVHMTIAVPVCLAVRIAEMV